MKKIISLILSLILCITLCSCMSTSKNILINEDNSITYNNNVYLRLDDASSFIIDINDGNWKEIARKPYGFLWAITIYYGNNSKNPEFITHSRGRGKDLYIREDLTFDNNTELSLCDLEEAYTFKLSEVTTENFIEFDLNKKFKVLCNFQASLKDYPYIKLLIFVCEYENKLYLQEAYLKSDYYEITETFKDDIYRLGINNFDYTINTKI